MPSTDTEPSTTPERGRARRLLRPGRIIAALFLLVIALGLLAIPFLKAPGNAQATKADLEAAKASLQAGDLDAAQTSVESARRHVDEVQGAMQGIGGDVWSLIPVVGAPVRDVRHLGNALDDLTAVAEAAVEVLPSVNGKDATLFGDRSVDVPTLRTLVGTVDEAASRLDSSRSELREVRDSSFAVGTLLAEARDDALDVVDPVADSAQRLKPLADALPELFGADSDRTYLLTLLNPSEQRFSGGAPLTMVPMEVSGGRLTMGKARDTSDPDLYKVGRWDKVEGNPFHNGKLRLSTATYAPDWSVSGEELLRGWERRTGQQTDGLVAVDVVAMADMLRITGPIETELYGTLDSTNFTQAMVGDYDTYPDNEARHRMNLQIVPAFSDRLFAPGQGLEKIDSLRTSAQGRHFALWMRDPEVQDAISEVGLAGDLSGTDHDYLAVFNQNTNESKSDYWQRRTVSSDVRLQADGSATVRTTISVFNDSPPYGANNIYGDNRGGSSRTRWNGMTVGVFLPEGAEISQATVVGRSVGTDTFDYYGRPYKLVRFVLPPRSTREAVLEYDVPAAAVVDGDDLTYRLDVTPQGMVIPQTTQVRVSWPKGYDVTGLPDGWATPKRGVATWQDAGLVTQPSFSVTGSAAGS